MTPSLQVLLIVMFLLTSIEFAVERLTLVFFSTGVTKADIKLKSLIKY